MDDRHDAFIDLLMTMGRGSNLIGPLSRDRVASDLIADALLPASIVPPRGPLVDVGSGAGLPGIPLAIDHPDLDVHLVEPRQKRTTFARIAARRLGLDKLSVHTGRIESFTAIPRGQVGTLAAKAFKPPFEVVKLADEWLAPDGLVYLYVSNDTWNPEDRARSLALGFVELGRAPHPEHANRFGLVLARKAPEDAP